MHVYVRVPVGLSSSQAAFQPHREKARVRLNFLCQALQELVSRLFQFPAAILGHDQSLERFSEFSSAELCQSVRTKSASFFCQLL